jgi:hypothetical protein
MCVHLVAPATAPADAACVATAAAAIVVLLLLAVIEAKEVLRRVND